MRVTYKGDYALKAVLDLAMNYDRNPVTSREMAERIDAPVKFLEQVLFDLKKGGFVESRRGNNGGYLLLKAPDKITVGDILRHIDGPTEPISCVRDDYSNCADINKCVLRKIWLKVFQTTSDIINRTTFEDLVLQVNAETIQGNILKDR